VAPAGTEPTALVARAAAAAPTVAWEALLARIEAEAALLAEEPTTDGESTDRAVPGPESLPAPARQRIVGVV
jgi:hypothetical protein